MERIYIEKMALVVQDNSAKAKAMDPFFDDKYLIKLDNEPTRNLEENYILNFPASVPFPPLRRATCQGGRCRGGGGLP